MWNRKKLYGKSFAAYKTKRLLNYTTSGRGGLGLGGFAVCTNWVAFTISPANKNGTADRARDMQSSIALR
jgi:hypothetical protein